MTKNAFAMKILACPGLNSHNRMAYCQFFLLQGSQEGVKKKIWSKWEATNSFWDATKRLGLGKNIQKRDVSDQGFQPKTFVGL